MQVCGHRHYLSGSELALQIHVWSHAVASEYRH